MDSNQTKLLEAIHEVDKKVQSLEVRIADGINQRFTDLERRVVGLEGIIKWVVIAFVGFIIREILIRVF